MRPPLYCLPFAIAISALLAACGGDNDPSQVGADPALASGAFVTTVTYVVGFFAFLGLAAAWLI